MDMFARKRAKRVRAVPNFAAAQAPYLPRAYEKNNTRKNKHGRKGAKARARMKAVLLKRFDLA